MLKRLKLKFICINMALLMGMLCVILGLVVHFTGARLEEEALRRMQAAARSFEPGRPSGLPEDLRLPCFVLRREGDGTLTADGNGYYDQFDQELLEELLEAALSLEAPSGVLREYGLRFLLAGGPQRPMRVVFADASGELAALSHLTRTCVLAGGLGFLALLLISAFLARWAVRPVERAWNQQKQFVADASHELKTPLTVIITNGELLQAVGCDERARQKYAGHILTMARQMRGLTESLLELARADSGSAERAWEELDLSRLISDALLPFEAVFFERGLTLAEEIEAGIAVKGDPRRLKQVADILLDNAQKYSASQGEITVAMRRKGRSRCQLEVASSGESIPQKELGNIFKRFYRLDRARSRDGSYGLGLSIARTIVLEHRGKIWAESGGGINRFFVELPVEGR